ncbi:MAG: sigma-70 family RNA polymerase sigma factor [Bdellovibrionales bacterium]|nr:sigma-70 family RNA polymerase sigma factor [Bdellovibrionales bacterium]
MEALSDFDLVKEVIGGRIEAFAILVERYQKPLILLSLRYVGDPFSAEDVVQESFLKAFEKLGSFQFRSAFKSWIYRITINTAKNRLRSRKPKTDLENVVLEVKAQCEDNVINRQLLEQIRQLIEELPEKQREAMELRVYEDKSFKEVARAMNCPYDTAKANYRHALLKIREEMEKAVG